MTITDKTAVLQFVSTTCFIRIEIGNYFYPDVSVTFRSLFPWKSFYYHLVCLVFCVHIVGNHINSVGSEYISHLYSGNRFAWHNITPQQ